MGRLLASALDKHGKCPSVIERQEDATETVCRLLNRFMTSGEVFIAELVQCKKGTALRSLQDAGPDSVYYDIAERASLPGNERFMDSSAYICMLEDDMIILSFQEFPVKKVHGYLSWLLRERIGFNEPFHLIDLPDLDNEVIRRIANGDDYVTSIKVGNQIGRYDYTVDGKSKRLAFHGNLASNFFALLSTSLKEQFIEKDLGECIKVSDGIQVRYRKPGRKTDYRPELVDMLGALNGIDDDHISLETKQGKALKGKQLRLDIQAKVPFVGGNVYFQGLEKPMRQAIGDAIQFVRKN